MQHARGITPHADAARPSAHACNPIRLAELSQELGLLSSACPAAPELCSRSLSNAARRSLSRFGPSFMRWGGGVGARTRAGTAHVHINLWQLWRLHVRAWASAVQTRWWQAR